MATDAAHWQASQELLSTWSSAAAWTVLDADFGDGMRFQGIWKAWQQDPERPGMLHYVGIAPTAKALAPAIADHCSALGPGFHRISLEAGHISLTLCVGEVQVALAEHVFFADTVFTCVPTDKWEIQRMARRCKRGTRVHIAALKALGQPTSGTRLHELMQDAGFQGTGSPDGGLTLCFRFDPGWQIATSRSPSRNVVQAPARCAVIGAGIAGASVAQALALRGWQVSVFDQEAAPASQASGLPAGLVVPHVSADDSPRSRLTRSGSRLMVEHAKRLLVRGEDWAPSGVMEHKPGAKPLWHPQGAWIKPAAMVRALLGQSGIAFRGLTDVHGLSRHDGLWRLKDSQGQTLGPFEVVVLANALGCKTLIEKMPSGDGIATRVHDKIAALQAVHGTLSMGRYLEKIPGLPKTPVNGNGCFIPFLPHEDGVHWLVGASFETDAARAADLWQQHADNMGRLQRLLPQQGKDLAETLERGPMSLWSATRCVTHDRLPLAGPVDASRCPGLWVCVGMGSRGLSLSALCAELLAARLSGEPWPIESSLARSLDAQRHRKIPSRIRLVAINPSPEAD